RYFPYLRFFPLSLRPPTLSTLFPYTTLFRSSSGTKVFQMTWDELDAAAVEPHSRSQFRMPDVPEEIIRDALLGRGDKLAAMAALDRKSTRLNSSHLGISYAVFCLKKKIQ